MTKNLIATFTLVLMSATSVVAIADSDTHSSTTSFDPNKLSLKRDSLLSGDFGFQSNDLVNDVGDVPGNKHFGSLNLKYQSFSGSSVYKGLEITSRVNDQEVLQYSLKEALIEFRYSTSRFAMGRSILEWSHTDRIWGLGKINNRVNFDYFEPGQEGLVGLFYDKKYDNGFNISTFGSFVYVPELSQGMIIDKDKGTVTCKTAWCEAPTASHDVKGRNVPIFYDIDYPEISDVVLRYSLGIKAGFKFNKYVNTNAFYLRKPENNFSVSAEVTTVADVSEITAAVTPQFFYHDVIGSNTEININKNLKIYGSSISVIPSKSPDGDQETYEYTGIKPRKKKEDYLSGGALYNDGSLKAHAGYIARVSDFDIESDSLVEYPRWNQALHLAASKKLSRKIFVGFDYKYDMLTEDRLTMFKTSYSFGPSIIATLGVNVIGTNNSKDSFWSKYDNNDSVYSSLKYTF